MKDNIIDEDRKIIIGCNYHLKWQSHKSMRFVLVDINGDRAKMKTRITKKEFWTDVSDLIFIETHYNNGKANRLTGLKYKTKERL